MELIDEKVCSDFKILLTNVESICQRKIYNAPHTFQISTDLSGIQATAV